MSVDACIFFFQWVENLNIARSPTHMATSSTLRGLKRYFSPVGSSSALANATDEVASKAARTVTGGTVVGGRYRIPLEGVVHLDQLKKALTLVPRVSACSAEPAVPLRPFYINLAEKFVEVPRFWGLDNYGPAETDRRTLGEPCTLPAKEITLTEKQAEAIEAVMPALREGYQNGAMLCLPCGFGKTVVAIQVAARLGRKTLIIVHTTGLLKQWEMRLREFWPGVRIGIIQGQPKVYKRKTVPQSWMDTDVCVGMLPSLSQVVYSPDMYSTFGTIVVAECHHIAATTFARALPKFHARYVLVLSATPERDDGLTQALYWLMGPMAYRCARPGPPPLTPLT